MATLSVQPSPHALSTMNSRRAPLRDAPSSVLNSPLRTASTAPVGNKRSRPHAVDQRELAYQQGPPVKRQAVELDPGDPKGLLRKTRHSQPTALQRKLEAVRDARDERVAKADAMKKPPRGDVDTIRQWQRHYKKVFPGIKFYFDNIPADIHTKLSGEVRSLGAKEEAFFSNVITHVVTTRPIPSAAQASSGSTLGKSPKPENGQGKTINPLLLENQGRGKFTFEAPLGKKLPTSNNDFLIKAREMGMKVWPMEKLQRMLVTLLETNTGEQAVRTAQDQKFAQYAREQELSDLLRNEKRHTMADREWLTETIPFRGFYIYVHDMDEKTKPIMVRDYPKPATKEQGKWPQLRVVSANRCPFVEEPAPRRAATEPSRRPTEQAAHRSRAATAVTVATDHALKSKRILAENANTAGRKPSPSKPLDPPKNIPIKRGSTDQLPFWNSAQAALRKHPRFAQGEPVASGVQPSNVTSAIQSQMISSTAAGPGQKAGTTRELNALKRKVLERNKAAGAAELNYLGNVRAAINNEASRPSKRKALGNIVEEEEPQKRAAPRKKRVVEKECKPGYCENCRDKFDDFDEHVLSKAHRKFALASENWRELDSLLLKLERI